MKVIELYENASEPLISYEIIPPRRGGSLQSLLEVVEALMPFAPPFIDVTSHAAEATLDELPDGNVRRRIRRKRPGTIGVCAAIKGRYRIETVPHLLCNGFTREETEDALIELNYLGLTNVMALRGDDIGFRKPIPPQRTTNRYAIDLVDQIQAMNEGRYLDDLDDAAPVDFCIGVAGYPEKHFEAPNLERDLLYLKRKVDAGASYVVTQMFFDNAAYFSFVERCRQVGIQVPIVPGLKILTGKSQLQSLPAHFHVSIPEELAGEVEAAGPDRVKEVGVRWAIRQCEELLSAGVPYLHFYIMQRADTAVQVVSALRRLG